MDVLALVVGGSVLGGILSFAIAAVAWQNRGTPAATPFGWLTLAVGGWCFLATGTILADTTREAVAFELLRELVAVHVPPLFLVFVLAYVGYTRWLASRWLVAFWSVPVLYMLVVLTFPFHDVPTGFEQIEFVTVNGITAPYSPLSPVERIEVLWSFLTSGVGFFVLFQFYVRSRRTYRRQTLLIGLGTAIPVVVNAVYQTGAVVHPGLDPTPMAVTLTGLLVGWALFRYDLLQATPLATRMLVRELPDPVVVLDEDDRVVDSNPAAGDVVREPPEGDPHVEECFPGLLGQLSGDGTYSVRWGADRGATTRWYDPQVTTIEDQHGIERGRLVVLRNVTGQRRRQERLEAIQTATQRFIAAATPDQIARLSLNFVERGLDRDVAAVYLVDDPDDRLVPVATTDTFDALRERGDFVDRTEPAVEAAYEEGNRRVYEPANGAGVGRYGLFPLGEHGVLCVAFRDSTPTGDDEQFATILARTTQVALAQVERERELRRSRAAVENRNEQVEFFNGVLRHTLRNALLVIQGRADHLRTQVDESQRDHLDVVVRWCEDLARLSDDIRAVNDTVTATESERLEAVDLPSSIRTRATALREEFEEVSVTVDLDLGETYRVRANQLVDRVLDSVLTNAVRHNDAERPRVEVSLERSGEEVELRIADNGTGMSEEMKEQVVQRDLSTSQTADGFGLYFVSVVMNLYGGSVRFEDNHPRGTVAVLTFQASDPPAGKSQGTSRTA